MLNPIRAHTSVLLLVAVAAACGRPGDASPTEGSTASGSAGSTAPSDSEGVPTTGEGSSTGPGAGEVPVTATCVSAEEPVYNPYSDEPPQRPLCDDPTSRPLPEFAYLIDLSGVDADSPATCGPAFLEGAEAPMRIDPDAPFPQVLRLPALTGPDAECAALCDVEPTAFGLTVEYELPDPDPAERVLVVRVPPPWFLVIGNEGSATPCLDGRPAVLEYGKPLACGKTFSPYLGFATSDPAAPSVDVVVELLPSELASGPCCAYTCD